MKTDNTENKKTMKPQIHQELLILGRWVIVTQTCPPLGTFCAMDQDGDEREYYNVQIDCEIY